MIATMSESRRPSASSGIACTPISPGARMWHRTGWLVPSDATKKPSSPFDDSIAAYFDLEPVEVYGVASFYPMFHLRPVGKHVVGVCHNISCDLRGAREILARVCRITGAPVHGTSPDGRFTVATLECQGACANAPMLDLDGVYHEDLDVEKVERILGGLA